MSSTEVYNQIYGDLQKSIRENDELRKQINRQNKEYNHLVSRYQMLQQTNYALQQDIVTMKVLHSEAMLAHRNMEKFLGNIVKEEK